VEVNEANGTIVTHALSAHYKRSRNGATLEERDLTKSEITATTLYGNEAETKHNGTDAL